MQWLNDLTKGALTLYGVELQLWRIGSSDPAPRFEVVCRPNEIVREASEAVEAEEYSETKKLQLAFWKAVRESLEQTGKFATLAAARPQYWFDVPLGRARIRLSLIANTYDNRIGVRVYLEHRVAARALEQLAPMRPQIEAEIGSTLEWNPHPENQDKIIRLVRPGNIGDQTAWPELIEWLTSTTVRFKEVFGPRILALDLSPAVSSEDQQGP